MTDRRGDILHILYAALVCFRLLIRDKKLDDISLSAHSSNKEDGWKRRPRAIVARTCVVFFRPFVFPRIEVDNIPFEKVSSKKVSLGVCAPGAIVACLSAPVRDFFIFYKNRPSVSAVRRIRLQRIYGRFRVQSGYGGWCLHLSFYMVLQNILDFITLIKEMQ